MAQPPSPLPPHEGTGVKAAVNQQFSQAAAHYSASPIHASGPDLAEMVRAAQLSGHETLLDAGCGPGSHPARLSEHARLLGHARPERRALGRERHRLRLRIHGRGEQEPRIAAKPVEVHEPESPWVGSEEDDVTRRSRPSVIGARRGRIR